MWSVGHLVELEVSKTFDLQPWTGQVVVQILRGAHAPTLVCYKRLSSASRVEMIQMPVPSILCKKEWKTIISTSVAMATQWKTPVTSSHLGSSHLISAQPNSELRTAKLKLCRQMEIRSSTLQPKWQNWALTDILANTDITRFTTGSRTTLFTEPNPRRRLITELRTPIDEAIRLFVRKRRIIY